jgi:hypothetical protein
MDFHHCSWANALQITNHDVFKNNRLARCLSKAVLKEQQHILMEYLIAHSWLPPAIDPLITIACQELQGLYEPEEVRQELAGAFHREYRGFMDTEWNTLTTVCGGVKIHDTLNRWSAWIQGRQWLVPETKGAVQRLCVRGGQQCKG